MPVYRIDKDSNKRLHDYRIIVNFTDSFGKYRKKEKILHNALLKDANKLEAQMQLEIHTKSIDVPQIRFNELVNAYLKSKKGDDRIQTIQKLERTFNSAISPFFQNIQIDKITPKMINDFRSNLNTSISQQTCKPFSYVYKKNIMGYLRSLFLFAKRFYNLGNNPCEQVEPIRDTNLESKNDLRFMRLNEFIIYMKALKDKVDNNKDRYDLRCLYVFFAIAFFCGLRKSEIYGLDWKHYDGDELYIEFVISQKVKGERIHKDRPKNRQSIRRVPVCNYLKAILDEHKAFSRGLYQFNDDFYIVGGLVPIRDTFVNVNKEKIIKSLKGQVPFVTVHEFRHSFASLLINQGVNIKVISKLMGHSTVDLTWNLYGHLYPEAENEAIKKIDELTKINV